MIDDPASLPAPTVPTPCLHVYGADDPHDGVFLIGEPIAWQMLAAAISAMRAEGGTAAPLLWAADGEGFPLYLACWAPDDPRWATVWLPYAEDWRPGAHPAALISTPAAQVAWHCAACGHTWLAPPTPALVACPACPVVGLVDRVAPPAAAR